MANLNYNLAVIGGTLGRDAEIKALANGSSLVTLNVATSENWQKDGEWQKKTTWHSIKYFTKNPDYLLGKCVKGASVLVEGSINTDEYEKDGVKKYSTYIKADSVKVVSGKQDGFQGTLQKQESNFSADTIPF